MSEALIILFKDWITALIVPIVLFVIIGLLSKVTK